MNITILCGSDSHPVASMLKNWKKNHESNHSINLVYDLSNVQGGELLFLISCSVYIPLSIRQKFEKTLVIHASDLPKGRGWSPHIWSVIEGDTIITVTLLEAEDSIDSGDIWHQIKCDIPKHSLYDDINYCLFDAEYRLMDFAIENFNSVNPQPQSDDEATYYKKRNPEDSELDIHKTIKEQFDLMRVSDPSRYPSFFKIHGKKYNIYLERVEE